ncbi:MAG: CobB/CobQ domain protein glutamine amidotransferase [Candidatus Levybacteria bacterium GW2011_GWB1_36_18]|nr:MAG: CobB/CobQ domain protein glutamine amidotransferase [Candidatus Levybacteria bacterium GW2011_GWB1_36_18]
MHGPILPKNPKFADYLIKLALKVNELPKLDDTLELQAHRSIAKRLGLDSD